MGRVGLGEGLVDVMGCSSCWGHSQRSSSSRWGRWEAAAGGGGVGGCDGAGGGNWPWRSRGRGDFDDALSREEEEGKKMSLSENMMMRISLSSRLSILD